MELDEGGGEASAEQGGFECSPYVKHFLVSQRMIQRIVSVWIAIGSAAAVAFFCHLLAGEAGRHILYQMDSVLPLISKILGISIIFIAIFALAIAFPFIPGAPSLTR
ncbi:MAG: hypothetical protein OSA84_00775 [Akkermansiaceae bacterium]|nr:hypothetical protein [Akkermansiaceae bacterium]